MLNRAISGLSSTIFNVPFQIIRTCMMVHQTRDGKPQKMIHTIKSIYKKDGIKGFYRGFFHL